MYPLIILLILLVVRQEHKLPGPPGGFIHSSKDTQHWEYLDWTVGGFHGNARGNLLKNAWIHLAFIAWLFLFVFKLTIRDLLPPFEERENDLIHSCKNNSRLSFDFTLGTLGSPESVYQRVAVQLRQHASCRSDYIKASWSLSLSNSSQNDSFPRTQVCI